MPHFIVRGYKNIKSMEAPTIAYITREIVNEIAHEYTSVTLKRRYAFVINSYLGINVEIIQKKKGDKYV